MAISLRIRGLLVLAGAVLLVIWAQWYTSRLLGGVIVSGAGIDDANGYYRRDFRTPGLYEKMAEKNSWRVPNVFDLIATQPRRQSNEAGFKYSLLTHNFSEWWITRSGVSGGYEDTRLYKSQREYDSFNPGYPPPEGWQVASREYDQAVDSYAPAPEVKLCGHRLWSDIEGPYGVGYNQRASDDVRERPSTTILLVFNLGFAYYLWSRRVSPEAVAISYSAFWESKEYWRVVTASFSHFEIMHLVFNMMGLLNYGVLEILMGSFLYFYLSLDLVVMTIVLVILVQHFLVHYRGLERYRNSKAVGYSCVLFANMVCVAVAQRTFCPMGPSFYCFPTSFIRVVPGWPPLPVNIGPFALLFLVQFIMPRAGFLGHLAGILLGYLMAWHLLDYLSTPILAGACVIAMLYHSKGWARQMPDYTLLLQGWSAGEPGRVWRTSLLQAAFFLSLVLLVLYVAWFTWGVVVAEALAVVVGYNALQAMKCCCCPDSVQAEHKYCVNLLKAYGVLCCILLATDLMSIGGVLGQWDLLVWSGVSVLRLGCGLAILVMACVIHTTIVVGCVGSMLYFRDGQIFLTSMGLGRLVTMHSMNAFSSISYSGLVSGSSATQNIFFRGGGRTLGSDQGEVRSLATGSRERSVGRDPPTRTGTGLTSAAAAAIRRSGGNPGLAERGGVRGGRGEAEEPSLQEEQEREKENLGASSTQQQIDV